jgi:outer membrane protein assembly factor BamA
MKVSSIIWVVILIGITSGCSNTRFLAENQVLYTGREKVELVKLEKGTKASSAKNYVESITNHKVNNALFGRRVLPPIGLWTHNYVKAEKDQKFKSWIYKTLASDPILLSDVNPELRAKKIENDLFDKGYFHSKAWAEVHINPKNPHKARVKYFVELAPPVIYNKVTIDTLTDYIDTLISRDKFMSEIRTGDQFNLEKIKASRGKLSRRIQNNGYFYFMPDYVQLKADTVVEKGTIDLNVGKAKNLPQQVTSVYTINDIVINNLSRTDTISSNIKTVDYEGIKIISSGDKIKNEVLANAIDFKKGETYSYNTYQSTLNHLNNLGVFKYVNITFQPDKTDSLNHLLNVVVDLIKADNIMADFEANFMSKSSGYIGPQAEIGVSHNNTFHGAERLRIGLTGGFEWQWGTKTESQLGTYSYQAGINTGLTLPRISIPFRPAKKNKLLLQRTIVNADITILNRIAYYKEVSGKINLQYQWSKTSNIQHSFYPIYINSVNLLATTPEFDSVVNENIYIRKSFEEQFILGPRYEFSYNNTLTTKPNNFMYQAGINTSGNFIDLFASMGKEPSERPYYFLNNIYSQFVKITSDFRYYRNGYNKSLAFRFYAGIGMPYNNSTALPYVEQFFSGGAYSIRGFTARYLGPGSYHDTDQSGYIDQSGDLKLESNLEFRFDMSKVLKGALFVDAGNIWLVNEDINRPGAKFNANTFYEQIAVAAGFGFRFDFNFFVLRTDAGFPIRNPYPTDNKYWLFGSNNIFSSGLFHLAIGYPF